MATENSLKQRTKDDPSTIATSTNNGQDKRAKKIAMARRGLKSLAVAIVVPLALTMLTIFAFGSTDGYYRLGKRPLWHVPPWAIYLASLSSSCLLGLSAWLIWAEGGFHQHPCAMPMYFAQFLLGLMWNPIVLGRGDAGLGLILCILQLLALYRCYRSFQLVNPIAGDLVKPSLAWVVFLGVMNFKLL